MRTNRTNTLGFTMLEMMVSSAIMTVISLLCFIALRASSESAALAQAKAEVQANLRDTLNELTQEVREAYTDRTVAPGFGTPIAPEDTESIAIAEEGLRVTFQVPVPTDGSGNVTSTSPISIEWRNEDTNTGDGFNAVLDPGEDANEDGALTRRLVRIQDGLETVVGGANNISGCFMQLVPSANVNSNLNTTFFIWLEASKSYGIGDKIVRAEAECSIDLVN